MRKWALVTLPLAAGAVVCVVWVLSATGSARPNSTPATVRLAIYADGRLIRDLTVAVCRHDESCPPAVFPDAPPGAPQLGASEVLVVRASRPVALITLVDQAPLLGVPTPGQVDGRPAPTPARPITLARLRATDAIRARLPAATRGPRWLVLTVTYPAGAATVLLPVDVAA